MQKKKHKTNDFSTEKIRTMQSELMQQLPYTPGQMYYIYTASPPSISHPTPPYPYYKTNIYIAIHINTHNNTRVASPTPPTASSPTAP